MGKDGFIAGYKLVNVLVFLRHNAAPTGYNRKSCKYVLVSQVLYLT